jgi:hypothetical protein
LWSYNTIQYHVEKGKGEDAKSIELKWKNDLDTHIGGLVALVKPNTRGLKIISSFRINDGKGPYWAHPSICNGMLLIRHGSHLMGYDVSK